jgi:hypothetical protein
VRARASGNAVTLRRSRSRTDIQLMCFPCVRSPHCMWQ